VNITDLRKTGDYKQGERSLLDGLDFRVLDMISLILVLVKEGHKYCGKEIVCCVIIYAT